MSTSSSSLPINHQPSTINSSPRPEWDAVRETTAAITHHGRLYLRGQVRLGMLLAGLKKAHSCEGSGRRNKVAESATLISWPEIMLQETGFARRQGDEFIRLYESVCAKLNRSATLALPDGMTKDALILFEPSNAHALTESQWETLDTLIGNLTSGETQASLLMELGVIARPRPMPSSNTPAQPRELTEQETAGQLAFHFFEGVTSSLVNTRCNPDYLMLLHALPLTSTTEQPLSLAYIEAEARALLHDIERVKEATAKPAKGRVLGN